MQLFITEYQKKENTVMISNPDLLSQLRKVLRTKIGDSIWVQNPKNEAQKVRYEVCINGWDDKTITGTILSEQIHHLTPGTKSMIIAMPNKWEKAELIIQKLTEIGISKIIFWPSERSILKTWNNKKEERFQKIINEAVEQSWGWAVPELIFTSDFKKHLDKTEVIIFDKTGTRDEGRGPKKEHLVPSTNSHITGIVGPEGGLTAKDYQNFETYAPKVIRLGDTVLRMETAAIAGGRLIKNNEG